MPLQPVSFRALNLSGRLPVFLTVILYSTVWPSLPLISAVVSAPSPLIFCSLSIVKDGSAATLTLTMLEVLLPVPSLPSIEASLVYVPTASTWVQVKDSSSPTFSSVAPEGVMPSQPVSFSAPNLSGRLPVFLAMNLYSTVWPSLPLSSPVLYAAFARDPLLLFERERRFGGDFGGDFVGGLGAGAFVAFDRGFVGVGADRQHVAAGEGLFFADGDFGGAGRARCLRSWRL